MKENNIMHEYMDILSENFDCPLFNYVKLQQPYF